MILMHIEPIKFSDVKDASDSVNPESRYHKLINFGMSEIERFEQEKLTKQCVAAINVKVESDAPSGTIPLSVLSLVSGGLQRIYDSICNNLVGNKKSVGPIPKEILAYSSLLLIDSSPGSFNLHIDHNGQKEQLELPEIANLELLPELENAFQIIHSTEEDIGKIIEHYGPRTFNITKQWFQKLQHNNIEFTILRAEKDSLAFSKEHIKSTHDKLSDVKVHESSDIEMAEGFVTGANTNTNTLNITLENGEKISAQASPKILHQNLVLLTVKYTIRFKVTKIRHLSTEKTKKTYQVMDII